VENPGEAAALGRRIFSRADSASPGPVSAWAAGSNFQVQVWRALLRLPRGYLWSYAELAARAGSPGAARAAGSAMTVNPLAYLIPCHRVLRQSGEVGQYHWGEERKALMVGWEAAQRECPG
jgi:AraC family transcriptional regulator of adaptative response/methylated-DNA-[protein]-cysteine methyltransferase